jgi:hypothetical protein
MTYQVPAPGVAPLLTHRDTLRAISPPWLQNGLAQKILYAVAVQLDAAGDALLAGVKMRFPNLYSAESLALIGRERRIRRGLVEADQSYTNRLIVWRETHKRRGGAYAMLTQLFIHYAPNNFPIMLAYRSGAQYDLAVDGTITRVVAPTLDGAEWANWTMVYFTTDASVPNAPDLATIPREWIAAHCLGRLVIAPPGTELWDYPAGHTWDESGQWNTSDATTVIPIKS